MLELGLQVSFTTFCSGGTHYGTSSAATLLVENIKSSSLLEFEIITAQATVLTRIQVNESI